MFEVICLSAQRQRNNITNTFSLKYKVPDFSPKLSIYSLSHTLFPLPLSSGLKFWNPIWILTSSRCMHSLHCPMLIVSKSILTRVKPSVWFEFWLHPPVLHGFTNTILFEFNIHWITLKTFILWHYGMTSFKLFQGNESLTPVCYI